MSLINYISVISMPIFITIIILFGINKNIDVYSVFLDGAKKGLETLFKITPTLVGLLTAVSIFRASGALDFIIGLLSPLLSQIGFPTEVLPLALLRPVSGSASLALVTDILKVHGPDTFIGRLTSVMMGSTETIFYTLAVYFGSVGIRDSRYTLWVALMADAAGIVAAIVICRILFL
jgi:spore maturation protein B